MPVSSSTEHWIKPDALSINLNHFGDPDYLQVSVLAGAVVMAFKQDVIGYNAAHNYRTWPLEAANTYLETTSAYNVYARLTRSEVNARALVVYDTVLRDIEGREITYAEDGSEVLGEANPEYFFVFLGQISASVNSGGVSVLREWSKYLTTGNLDTNQQRNDTTGLLDLMFRPHYDNPLDPNEITWIEALTHLGVAGGITMYVNGGKLDIPSIYAGLPIDGKTIYWDNGVLKAVGSSGGGGVADSVSWSNVYGKPSWITDTKPVYSYTEIQGVPDLSVYATNKALEALGLIVDKKADKSYVDDNFVTIATGQDITGLKNFVNGLLIDGIKVHKSQDGVLYIDGNLAVKGGITMYAEGSVDIPTIMDGIVVDGTTIINDGGILKINPELDLGGLDEAELEGYLTANRYVKESALTEALSTYATQAWVNARGFATTSDLDSRINALVNGAPAAYDTLKEIADVLQGNVNSIGDIITTLGTKWTQDDEKIAKWDTAYGWGNHANAGYALKSYVDGKFVTLATDQTISGLKNFSKGLELGGISVYKSQDGVVYIEGNLVAQGSITMYGTGSTDVPSIIDALPTASTSSKGIAYFDSNYFSVSSDGKVSFIGETGGLDLTALQNYLTQNSYLNVTEGDGRYLKLSGGTLTGALTINKSSYSHIILNATDANGQPAMMFSVNNAIKGYVGYAQSAGAYIYNAKAQKYLGILDDGNVYFNGLTFWHSGNFTPSNYLPLNGGTIGGTSDTPLRIKGSANVWVDFQNSSGVSLGYIGVNHSSTLYFSASGENYKIWHEGIFNPADYLPLTGGTITGELVSSTAKGCGMNVKRLGALANVPYVQFSNEEGVIGEIGVAGGDSAKAYPVFWDSRGGATRWYTIWYSNNDGDGSGLDADLLDGKHLSDILASNVASATRSRYLETLSSDGGQWYVSTYRMYGQWGADNNSYLDLKVDDYSVRVDISKKLNTARTIWGQSFDGTKDISGKITTSHVSSTGGLDITANNEASGARIYLTTGALRPWGADNGLINLGNAGQRWNGVYAKSGDFSSGLTLGGDLIVSGLTGLGVTSPNYRLDVSGTINTSDRIYTPYLFLNLNGEGIYLNEQSIAWHNDSNTWVKTLATFTLTALSLNVNIGTPMLTLTGSDNYRTTFKMITYLYIQPRIEGSSYNVNTSINPDGGNVGIGTTTPAYKLDVNGDIATNQYLRVKAWSGYGSGSCDMWYNGSTTKLVVSSGASFAYDLVVGGAVNVGSTLNVTGATTMSNATITGNLRLKDSTNYGKAIYFGDGAYCYIAEKTDDVMTIFADKGLIIDNSTTINGNLLVKGGITMYGTDGTATDFLLDVTSWSSISSTSTTQVYTARTIKLLKDQVNTLTNKIANIKSALSGITSSSSASAIGTALNNVYNNI